MFWQQHTGQQPALPAPPSTKELNVLTTSRNIVAGALLCVALVALTAAPSGARPLGHNGQIAFDRYDPLLDDSVPYTVNPDGSHEQRVLDRAGGPRWSPDSTRLSTCCSPLGDSHSTATIVNPDDPGSYVALPQPDPDNLDVYCGPWSPDGARLACETYGTSDDSLNGIYTIRSSDGGGLRRITSNTGSDQPGDYSPDGKRLVYSHFPGDERDGLYVVNGNGTGARKIAPCCTSQGSWSPQGNEIVFSRRVTPDVHSTIWVVHADGSGLYEINVQVPAGQYPCGAPNSDPTAGGCFSPRWSPDGKKIVFVRGDHGIPQNIYTINADGSGLTQVTHGGADESNNNPDWGTHPLAHD